MISCIELLQKNLNGEFLITKQLMESKRRYMIHSAFGFFKYAANCDDWSQLSVLCSTLNIHLRLTHISTITSDILRVCLDEPKVYSSDFNKSGLSDEESFLNQCEFNFSNPSIFYPKWT